MKGNLETRVEEINQESDELMKLIVLALEGDEGINLNHVRRKVREIRKHQLDALLEIEELEMRMGNPQEIEIPSFISNKPRRRKNAKIRLFN